MTRARAATADVSSRLARLLAREPPRAGSLIVTLFGDAVLSRGGVLSLAALTRALAPFAVKPGQIRTALSRLVADGWFERRRDGRASHYALARQRAEEFEAAMRRVYGGGAEPAWRGELEHVIIVDSDPARRAALRQSLRAAGYGQLAPGAMIRPLRAGDVALAGPAGAVVTVGPALATTADLGRIGETAWALEAPAAGYRRFVASFAPLSQAWQAALERAPPETARDAFLTRVLLVHAYRRVALNDPMLPPALLPAGWPGIEARAIFDRLYGLVRAPSEEWLAEIGSEAWTDTRTGPAHPPEGSGRPLRAA
jgi:phenylacetic acid degradation operon negative regulatory protein